jgi:hypothetical protein
MNEIGALVAGAKIKEIEMLSGDSDYISLGNEGTCESDDQKREVKLGLTWRKSAEEKLRSVMGTGEVVVIFFLVPTFSHGTHYGVVTGRGVSIEKTGATLKVVGRTMEGENEKVNGFSYMRRVSGTWWMCDDGDGAFKNAP